MNVLLVNQFGPSSGAPTGRIIGELAEALAGFGHTTRMATRTSFYGNSRGGWRRQAGELYSHFVLLVRGWFGSRPDVVISLTSPACLAVTAGWIARMHRAHHIHWAMDIYPDLALQLGELPGGLIARLLNGCVHRAYTNADLLITLDEDMRQHLLKSYDVDSCIIAPFPPEVVWPPSWQSEQEPSRWLYSGNFGRAHEIDVLLQIQKILEIRGIKAELILQGHGPQFQASKVKAASLGLRRVRWNPPCPQEELAPSLLQAQILVVTRQAKLKGLLLPSKLMLAELSGRSVLWIGDVDSHTARRLVQEGRHGVFRVNDVDAIAVWLEERLATGAKSHSVEPRPTADVRLEAMTRWKEILALPSLRKPL